MDSASVFERLGLFTQHKRNGVENQLLSNRWLHVAVVLFVAAGYYAGTRIGFSLTPQQTPIALFWPPNAVLLAAFLLTPVRFWWAYLAAVLPAHLLAQTHIGIPVITSLGWYVGNTGEALIGAATILYISRVRKTHFNFDDTKGLTAFLIGAILLAPMVTSFIDAAVVVSTGHAQGYWVLWATRLVSNVISNLTLVPAIVTFFRGGFSWFKRVTVATWLELVCLFLGAAFISFYVFSLPPGAVSNISAAIFLPLPFLLWAALRFRVGGISASLLLVALIALCGAAHGQQTSNPNAIAKNVLILQVLIGAFGVPLMWLASVISERQTNELSLTDRRRLLLHTEDALRQIGRKLHGELTQQLTLLGLDVENMTDESETRVSFQERLQILNDQIAQLSLAARDWSHALDPVSIEYLGLAGAIGALCRQVEERSTIKFDFIAEDEGGRQFDSITALSLYRIVQEAIENIVKHSSARTARIKLDISEKGTRLAIEDDGTGMTGLASQESGAGIINMRERVVLLGGTFFIESSPAGTKIEVLVPIMEPGLVTEHGTM